MLNNLIDIRVRYRLWAEYNATLQLTRENAGCDLRDKTTQWIIIVYDRAGFPVHLGINFFGLQGSRSVFSSSFLSCARR